MAETGEGRPSPVEVETARVDAQFARIEREAIPDPEKSNRRAALGRRYHLELHNVLESYKRGRLTDPETVTAAATRVLTAAKHEAYAQIPAASQFVLQKLLEQRLSPAAARALAPVIYDLATATPVRDNAAKVAEYLKGQYNKIRTHDPQLAQTVRDVVGSAAHYFGLSPARLDNDFPPPDEPPAAGAGGEGGGGEPPEEPPEAPPAAEDGEDGEDDEDETRETERPRSRRTKEEQIGDLIEKRMEIIEQFAQYDNQLQMLLQNIVLSDAIHERIRSEVERRLEGSTATPEDIERQVQMAIEQNITALRGQLIGAYQRYITSAAWEDMLQSKEDFLQVIQDLEQRGLISMDDREGIESNVNEIHRLLREQRLNSEKLRALGVGAEQAANTVRQRRGREVVKFTDEEEALRAALSSPEALLHYLQNSGRYDLNSDNWWETFYNDVSGLFDTVLSVAEGQPNEPFQNSFNPLLEGAIYKELLDDLRGIGRELAIKDQLSLNGQMARSVQVKITGTGSLPSHRETDEVYIAGKKRLAYKNVVSVSLDRAIGTILAGKMVRKREYTEYFHNVEFNTRLGTGFEALAQGAERFTTADLDSIWSEDPETVIAYNAYIQNLRKMLGMNAHVISSDFGAINTNEGLDDVQTLAYYQVLGQLKPKLGETPEAFARRIKRKVRMASGIAKGGTAEFWKILLTSKLLVGREIIRERDGTIRVKVAETYTSAQHGGTEKNLALLDIDKLLERFGIPHYQQFLRYAFIPRDLDEYAGAWKDKWRHGDVYWVGEETEHAYFRGRSEKLANFDYRNATFAEKLRVIALDVMARDGWRFDQYNAYLVDREGGGIDFDASLTNVKDIGLYLMQRFIRDHWKDADEDHPVYGAYVQQLSRVNPVVRQEHGHDIRLKDELDRLGKKRGYRTKREKASLKKIERAEEQVMMAMYEREVFARISSIRPSEWVALERMRFTPGAEVESAAQGSINARLYKFLQDRFSDDYPPEFIEGKILPLFVGALSAAENTEWQYRTEEADTKEYDYEFTAQDLFSQDKREGIERFFNAYIQGSGEFIHPSDPSRNVSFRPDFTFAQFERQLPEFFGELKQAINMTRTDETGRATTLEKRYARLLLDNLGDISFQIGGSDFKLDKFLLQQAGSRIVARIMGEAHAVASEVQPAQADLINNGFVAMTKGQYDGLDAVEKAAQDHLGKSLDQMLHTIHSMDPHAAWRYAKEFAVLIPDRILGMDRNLRLEILGPMVEMRNRIYGIQASIMTDAFPNTLERPTTAFDGDGVNAMMKTLLNGTDIPWKEGTIVGYEKGGLNVEEKTKRFKEAAQRTGRRVERVPLIGSKLKRAAEEIGTYTELYLNRAASLVKPLKNVPGLSWMYEALNPGKPIYHINEHYAEQSLRVGGFKGIDRVIENWPIAIVLALAVIAALALVAREKNQERK